MTLKTRLTFGFGWFCVLCLVWGIIIGVFRVFFHATPDWKFIGWFAVLTIVIGGIALPTIREAKRDWKMTSYERWKSS